MGKRWFIELDLEADPEVDRRDVIERLRDWYDETRGFVRIMDNTVEAEDIGEVMELKFRLHDHVRSVRKVRA